MVLQQKLCFCTPIFKRWHLQRTVGTSCLDVTKDLEEALGGQVEERKMTHEASESEGVPVEERQQQHI